MTGTPLAIALTMINRYNVDGITVWASSYAAAVALVRGTR